MPRPSPEGHCFPCLATSARAAGLTVDKVGDKLVFNIGGNKWRLIAQVNFERQIVKPGGVHIYACFDPPISEVISIHEYAQRVGSCRDELVRQELDTALPARPSGSE